MLKVASGLEIAWISGLAGRVGLAWTMLVVTAGGALAQSDHGAAHGGDAAQGAEHASGGLPQLNPDFFSPQLIWLGISFITLYYLMSKVALPKVAEVLEERQERITNDLDRAGNLRRQAGHHCRPRQFHPRADQVPG